MLRILVAMLAFAVVGASPAHAYHRKTPTLVQITPGSGAGTIGNPRWAGFRYVVFDSDADLLSNGSIGRQVFYFDLQERDRTGLPSVHQLTSDDGDNRHGSTGSRAKVIAYDAQPGGTGPRQIKLVPRLSGAPWALTAGSADSINPVMDDGGRFVVFESQADLLGLGFTGSQVYLADLRIANPTCPYPCAPSNNAGLTQITRKAGNSTHPVVSKAGKFVAFESSADLLNAGENENQIYVSDVFASQITRPTKGPGASQNPSMSKNGSFIAFDSAADLLGNGSTGTQVFLYKRKESSLQQVTHAAGAQSQNPSVELTGRGVLFDSDADLLGNGSTGPQIFEFTVAGATTRQVTDTGAGTSDPAHSAGVFTVFISNADLMGNGSTGSQLYLVNLFALPFNSRVP